jgi:hypothetical protein
MAFVAPVGARFGALLVADVAKVFFKIRVFAELAEASFEASVFGRLGTALVAAAFSGARAAYCFFRADFVAASAAPRFAAAFFRAGFVAACLVAGFPAALFGAGVAAPLLAALVAAPFRAAGFLVPTVTARSVVGSGRHSDSQPHRELSRSWFSPCRWPELCNMLRSHMVLVPTAPVGARTVHFFFELPGGLAFREATDLRVVVIGVTEVARDGAAVADRFEVAVGAVDLALSVARSAATAWLRSAPAPALAPSLRP